jgi:2-succinyl-5-enolpyruvyl-6-hydroxy-3-cyclohexene-1-carboxylate synthase
VPAQTAAPLVVVLLNNSGGGIFRYLPIAGHADVYSPYFDTPHALRFGDACRGFGVAYELVRSAPAFATAYAAALAARRPCVLEVLTDKEENLRTHRALCAEAAAVARETLGELVEPRLPARHDAGAVEARR